MPTSLPRSTPSAEGVDAEAFGRFVDALEAAQDIDPHSVMLVVHGKVVAEGWWAPYTAERLHLLYSLSKTFMSTAAGFAVAEGLLGLDDAVADHFPAFRDELPERSRRIRVRDALAMASGHHQDMIQAAVMTDPAEPVRGFLLHEPESEPGTVFAYNQPANYTVAAIVQQAAGTDLVGYLRPRLLDPLGIGPVSWQQVPEGRSIGFSGLHATTEAIAKLGLLHLRDGVWEGEQLLPAGWAEATRTRHIGTDAETNVDWAQGYGYQVWMARHGYRGDGAYGQFCVILPEQDAVLVTTMATDDMQQVLDAAWQHVLPALGGGGTAEADDALAARLGGLALEPSAGEPAIERPPVTTWRGDVAAELQEDGRVRLSDGVTALLLPIGGDGWTVVDDDTAASPVAVSGGWRGDVLHLDVLFLESPHRMDVQLAPDGTATATFRTQPLVLGASTPLLAHRAPLPLG
ncbi:serine hydrolase domain-containing protein [Amnibacterium endophyticum]|uniref:Serine hydrolase domain-containing protein n=1 Tax=Amnibacterium endophyticum TaxID=2109337 RepID=A0ABW4LIX9_9MICO